MQKILLRSVAGTKIRSSTPVISRREPIIAFRFLVISILLLRLRRALYLAASFYVFIQIREKRDKISSLFEKNFGD